MKKTSLLAALASLALVAGLSLAQAQESSNGSVKPGMQPGGLPSAAPQTAPVKHHRHRHHRHMRRG